MNNIVKQAQEIAYSEHERTGMPPKQHIDLSVRIGKRLARSLGADIQVVKIGCLMMDCLLGQSLKKGRLQDHIQMSLKRTEQWLSFLNIDKKTKENIK